MDVDIYRLPGSSEDFLQAWLALSDSAPARVVWTPRNGGHWIVLDGGDIALVYADHAGFSSRITLVPKHWGEQYPLRPTTLDPPEHQPYRRILARLLTASWVQRAELISRALARDAVERVRSQGGCDVVTGYAAPIPSTLFAGLAGIDAGRMNAVPGYADHLLGHEGSELDEPVMNRIANFLRLLIIERRDEPGDDIISSLLTGTIDDRPINDDEAVDVATALLTGGLDTVVSLFSMMMRHLAQDHALRRQLADQPALIPSAVRELARRFPIMTKARVVRHDEMLDGVYLKQGDMVVMPPLHGLDPTIFAEPLHVNLDRQPALHCAYGNGVHRCPGSNLAEAEMAIMLEEWLARIPEFELDPDEPVRMQGGVLGTVISCRLRWDAGTTRGAA